jgi:hypothetical protein
MNILMILAAALIPQTKVQWLSGRGLDDTVRWGFECSAGMNSGRADSIAVPSQWELQGFGGYDYGRWYMTPGAQPHKEEGRYTTSFRLDPADSTRVVRLLFDGVMTDASVRVNGVKAGPDHQGAFYRFAYDITDKVRFDGSPNQLEVAVRKHSANASVNAAERRADWWIFGGIYRPVRLELLPREHIADLTADCRADGSASLRLRTTPLAEGCRLRASLRPLTGKGKEQHTTVALAPGSEHRAAMQWRGVRPWTPESPQLYLLTLTLCDARGRALHQISERVGFRTVEFRPQDGLYLNDTRLVLKGINRHSFHPDGGRTTSRSVSLADARLIKSMNINAVRSHYPPDDHFLAAADSLGLLIIDELAGWHGAYDDTTAVRLLGEMMARDVNHPSVILWSNGNEGGWNTAVDSLFYQLDPQRRHVIHPWADFDGLDTHHYPAFLTGPARFTYGWKLFMPTEFMHGMYDQGHGAGLEDFWASYTASPLFVGGFLWDFCDNAVRRTDKGGLLDTDGSNAPDGILGPYREKEASYYAVREVWAPLQFERVVVTPSFRGDFNIRNTYLFTNLNACKLTWRLLQAAPTDSASRVVASGTAPLPDLPPQSAGRLHLDLPDRFAEADILELTALHPDGTEMCTWAWPTRFAAPYAARYASPAPSGRATVTADDTTVTLRGGDVAVTFGRGDGLIRTVVKGDKLIPLAGGPVSVGVVSKFRAMTWREERGEAVLRIDYLGATDSIVWRMAPDGTLRMDAVMLNRTSGGKGFDDALTLDSIPYLGYTFSCDEQACSGVRWLGRGPYRVWKNRLAGQRFGIWQKAWNNTVTGEPLPDRPLVYPEFKGYHGELYWLALLDERGETLRIATRTDGLYVRLFTPEEPQNKLSPEPTLPPFPEGDISFLIEIPAIRDFKPIAQQGPRSQLGMARIKKGDEGLRIALQFSF